jgi:hypothetical protein
VDSKPELQRVLEHRRRNQLIKKKKEELEAKRLQCPFEQELLRRQQRLNQVGEDTRAQPELPWLCPGPGRSMGTRDMGSRIHHWSTV